MDDNQSSMTEDNDSHRVPRCVQAKFERIMRSIMFDIVCTTLVRAVASDVSGLAVLPLVILLCPRIGAVPLVQDIGRYCRIATKHESSDPPMANGTTQ